MNQSCRLSENAKDYLSVFQGILDKMEREMTGAERTDSISQNFIVQMIPHHRAAIEMSKNILRYTTSLPLQEIAANIVEEQTKSIENMKRIQRGCAGLCNCERDLRLYRRRTDQIIRSMFAGMGRAAGTNRINCDFMREMIPHHRGAVEMSTNALQYDICPELIPILDAIITSQEKGIAQMQSLLKCMGC